MTQMSQVLRERAIGMLTARMSTRAAAREYFCFAILKIQLRYKKIQICGLQFFGLLFTMYHAAQCIYTCDRKRNLLQTLDGGLK